MVPSLGQTGNIGQQISQGCVRKLHTPLASFSCCGTVRFLTAFSHAGGAEFDTQKGFALQKGSFGVVHCLSSFSASIATPQSVSWTASAF